jgi:hypothetical protein
LSSEEIGPVQRPKSARLTQYESLRAQNRAIPLRFFCGTPCWRSRIFDFSGFSAAEKKAPHHRKIVTAFFAKLILNE